MSLAPGEEQISADESEVAQKTLALVRSTIENPPAGQLVKRDAHPKAHGCVHGTFTVDANLQERFAHGLFATPATYPVWIRFSNGNQTPDNKPDIRGMGIKLCQVPGEKILTDEKHTHDFLLINSTVMPAGTPREYYALFEALIRREPLAALFGIPPWRLPRVLAFFARAAFAETINPLYFRYWSTTPYRLGKGAVKYAVRPAAEMKVSEAKPPRDPGPDFLREAMAARLDEGDAVFDFLLQEQTNPATMPIEDASVEWSETASPFVKVGSIRIPKQSFRSAAQDLFGENLSINPWHCVAANRPLGGINRVRRVVYEAISEYRHARNGFPRIEPSGDERF